MRDLLIVNRDGVSVYLRDVATVSQGYKERQAIIRLDGSEAIELAIYKEGDANTVDVADRVKAALKRLESDIPPGAKLTQVDDQSVFIREALNEVRSEALLGGALGIGRASCRERVCEYE